MDRSPRLGTGHRCAVGSAHPPCPHLGDERRELPPEAEQAQARLTTELLIRPPSASTLARYPRPRTRLGEEDVFRSGLNAPPFRRRRPSLQTPSSPTIPISYLLLCSTFTPFLWSAFTPPLTPGRVGWRRGERPTRLRI